MNPDDRPTPQTLEEHLRRVNIQLDQATRRPIATAVSAEMGGPGIQAQAVEIIDWNSEEATYNGYYYTLEGGQNSPDDDFAWTGLVIARSDGAGIQLVYNPEVADAAISWMRAFRPDPVTGMVVFSEWKRWATPSGLIGVDDIDPAAPWIPDGDAPTNAPVLTGSSPIRQLAYRWSRIANPDPVTYELFVRAGATPTVSDDTYLVASGDLDKAFTDTVGGVQVDPSGLVSYHAVVRARDADGPGPVSNEVITVPGQVTSPDIAANVVSADFLLANNAFIEALEAVDFSAITMTAPTIQTHAHPTMGIKLKDGKLVAYDLVGDHAPFLDVDPAKGLVIVAGEGTFETLTTLSDSAFNGDLRIQQGKRIILTSGQAAPNNAPIVGFGYDTTTFTNDGEWANRRGWASDGTNFFTWRIDIDRLEKWSAAGVKLATSPQLVVAISGSPTSVSVACGGGKVFIGGVDGVTDKASIMQFDPVTMSHEMSAEFTTAMGYQSIAGGARHFAVGYDTAGGTDPLLIASVRKSDGVLRIHRATLSNPPAGTLTIGSTITTNHTMGAAGGYNLTNVTAHASNFDFGGGTVRYVVSGQDAVTWAYSTTGTRDLGAEWNTGVALKCGLAWTGTQFVAMPRNGILQKYSTLAALTQEGSNSLPHWVYVSYARNNAGTIVYETAQSPVVDVRLTFKKRSKMLVTGPNLIASPGATDANTIRVWVGSGSTEPVVGQRYLQTSGVVADKDYEYTSLPLSGTTHGSVAAFPNSGLASLVSTASDGDGVLITVGSDADWKLRGDPVDHASVSASGSYTGAVEFMRVGNRIMITGYVDRVSGFSATMHSTGVVAPTWARPSATRHFRAGTQFAAANRYRFRVLTDGTLEVQESAAVGENLLLGDVYML